MLTPSIFQKVQETFLAKVTSVNNTSVVTLKFLDVDYAGDKLAAFKGEGVRTVSSSVEMKCLYKKNISEIERQKYGLSQEVTAMVYISPLDLKAKTGSELFPGYTMGGYARMTVEFLGGYYEVQSITPLESQFDGKNYTCVAYQLNLKNVAGLKGMNNG